MTDAELQSLFETHKERVLRFLRRMTGDQELARDLTQETFLRAWRGRDTYRDQGQQAAWVFSIARRALSDLRARRFHPTIPLQGLPEAHSPIGGEPTGAFELNEALHDLPEAEREAFLLHELAGLRYNEIAQVTESTVDAVRSRLFRARMQLRERLTSSRTRLER